MCDVRDERSVHIMESKFTDRGSYEWADYHRRLFLLQRCWNIIYWLVFDNQWSSLLLKFVIGVIIIVHLINVSVVMAALWINNPTLPFLESCGEKSIQGNK